MIWIADNFVSYSWRHLNNTPFHDRTYVLDLNTKQVFYSNFHCSCKKHLLTLRRSTRNNFCTTHPTTNIFINLIAKLTKPSTRLFILFKPNSKQNNYLESFSLLQNFSGTYFRLSLFIPLWAKRVREVANLTERKNLHTILANRLHHMVELVDGNV